MSRSTSHRDDSSGTSHYAACRSVGRGRCVAWRHQRRLGPPGISPVAAHRRGATKKATVHLALDARRGTSGARPDPRTSMATRPPPTPGRQPPNDTQDVATSGYTVVRNSPPAFNLQGVEGNVGARSAVWSSSPVDALRAANAGTATDADRPALEPRVRRHDHPILQEHVPAASASPGHSRVGSR